MNYLTQAFATLARLSGRQVEEHNVTYTLIGPDGRVKQVKRVHNLFVTAGKNHIADQLASSPAQAAMGYMAIGTGTNAAAAGDTALQTEVARVALSSRTASANVVTYVATFPAGTGTGAITESGILNAASSGVLFARSVFSVINKGASDSLQITHTYTQN
jgi:ethanolamine utilization microcompartment shell protein EutS